jgi:hypothetical protein
MNPSPRLRVTAFVLAWLPPLALLQFAVPRCERILMRLDEEGSLSAPATLLRTFTNYDALSFHFLAFLAIVSVVTLDEVLLARFAAAGRGATWGQAWCWVTAVRGLALALLILFPLLQSLLHITSCPC